ncbi:hypothetical protein RUM44_009605 [Polyplax serrata]|uniref:Uncharacterized protein n=1 Tax=Polyplax serrata TaxID=468196 RepID=A0ABR1AUM2_POLSC
MTESHSTFKGSRKIRRDLLISKSSIYSGNSSLSEINSGRTTLPTVYKGQKLCPTVSLDKVSFFSDKEDLAYDEYELDYSTYLLRKLQNQILQKNNREKIESFKKCLVSLKLEYEELLKKHLTLNKTSMYIEMHMETLKECNKRIELGKIIKVFEENKLDILFNSMSEVLDQAVNQMTLIGLNKSDIEKVFSQEAEELDTELIDCLKKISDHSKRNQESIGGIAMEIVKIDKLLKENLILRHRYQNKFANITTDVLEGSYEALTEIVKRGYQRRLQNHSDSRPIDDEILKLEDLLQATLQPFTTEQLQSFQLSKVESLCDEKPTGTSTPHYGLH